MSNKATSNPGYLKMIAEFQNEMQSTTSLNKKKEILSLYHDASIIHLALHYAYSPYKQFGLTSKQCIKRPDLCIVVKEDLFDILEGLSTRRVTGHDAIRLINGFVMMNPDYMELVFCIIDKDLKLRANTKTINKVIPNCIPTFDVALAEKYEPGMCDFITDSWYSSRKLDGVRCLIRKEGDTITAFSRQGKEFETLQNVIDEVATFDGDFVLDGEVCMMDENGNEDFQGIMKQIRRKNHTIENPQFVIFDCVSTNEFDKQVGTRTLTERLEDV